MRNQEVIKTALAPTAECLSSQQLEAAAAGVVSGTHLAQCLRCQTEVAMLRSFESEARLPDEGAAITWISERLQGHFAEITQSAGRKSAKGQHRQADLLRRIAALGKQRVLIPLCVVVAMIASALLLERPNEPRLNVQLDYGHTVSRSEEIRILGPAGELRQPPTELRWSVVSGVTKFEVAIMEVDHSMIWKWKTNDNFVTIPPAVRDKLRPRKSLLWQVKAFDAQGKELAASQIQRFVVLPAKNSD